MSQNPTPWEQWRDAQLDDIEKAKEDPNNIRYYKGKYKVVVLPASKDALHKNYRTVAALETFPHHGIRMMINENDLFSTSTRWLNKEKLCLGGIKK